MCSYDMPTFINKTKTLPNVHWVCLGHAVLFRYLFSSSKVKCYIVSVCVYTVHCIANCSRKIKPAFDSDTFLDRYWKRNQNFVHVVYVIWTLNTCLYWYSTHFRINLEQKHFCECILHFSHLQIHILCKSIKWNYSSFHQTSFKSQCITK